MSGDHTKREITVTRHEYAVPSGADIKDFGLVQEWAWQDCARRNGWDPKGSRPDNWCIVHARDEVVFAFTVETKTDELTTAELDRFRKFQADHERCITERDAARSAIDRVIELLARETPPDGGPPLWIAAVHAAIEGTP